MCKKTMSTSSLGNIPECLLYQNHSYNYYKDGSHVPLFPVVDASYKTILDERDIPSREIHNGYEFWNPNYYQEDEITLPLFIQMAPDNFRLIQKKYPYKIPTTQTTKAAFELLEKVVKPLKNGEVINSEQFALISALRRILKNHAACGINRSRNVYLNSNYLMKKINLKTANANLIVFPVYTLISEKKLGELRACSKKLCVNPDTIDTRLITHYFAIFDMSRLKVGDTVDLFVPEGTERIFVGRGGWQLKEWCKELGGLSKINVIATK